MRLIAATASAAIAPQSPELATDCVNQSGQNFLFRLILARENTFIYFAGPGNTGGFRPP